jgi:hypothetical protein
MPTLTPDAMRAAMKIMAEEADRHAAAEAELAKVAAEEEARRARVQAELAKARTMEQTRAALGTLLAAVTNAYLAVADGDDAKTTAGLEAIYHATKELSRASRVNAPRSSTATGTRTGTVTVRTDRAAPRPLRPEVAAHLAAHPDKEFTPGEIGRVLGRSSGAVANALDTMAKTGQAVLTCEKPMRYRAAVTATAPDNA